MSKMTVETTITRQYLRNKTKDEIIELVMSGLDEIDFHAGNYAKAISALQRIYVYSRQRIKRRTTIYDVLMRWCEDGGVSRDEPEQQEPKDE